MPGLVKPHGGGSLKPLMLAGEALAAERARAESLPKLRVSSREKGDLIMLGIGGFTPLAGFMTRADWEGVCDGYRLASGVFWPIPITLSADEGVAGGIGTDVSIPASMRWIPKGMSVRYLKRATGVLTATATIAPITDETVGQDLHAIVEVRNTAGEVVFDADITMWVSPRKAA